MQPIYSPIAFLGPMPSELPPTIDPVAAQRWALRIPSQSPWLHEEVARRMEERLDLMTLQPATWVHWEPLHGGLQAHALLTKRYQKARCFVPKAPVECAKAAMEKIAPPWWKPARWLGSVTEWRAPPAPVQMVWANMALHRSADPQALIAQWHSLLATDGFLMFSCLGPDTLREIRQLYASLGWPPPSHEFTDMHDWGDMLVRCGFAEPVMDMERITLTFSSPTSLLNELRGLGRNLHLHRFAGLRGRRWYRHLQDQLGHALAKTEHDGRLELSFEIVYGHAFKPAPRLGIAPQSTISLEQMRATLAASKGRTDQER